MTTPLSRRGFLVAGLSGLAVGALPNSSAWAATGLESAVGAWSAPFDLGGIAIHAQLMFNDQVLYFQYIEGDPTVDHTSLIKTWDINTGISQLAEIGYHHDLFCAGMNQLPDGRVFVSGGHDHTTGERDAALGVKTTDIYNPLDRSWTPGPELSMKRWYPTAVAMPDDSTLIMGGGEAGGLPSPTVDRYDPATNTMTTLPNTATKNLGLYPRVHLLADGRLIKTGYARRSQFFDPSRSTWIGGPSMQYGSRRDANSVLLSGSTRALTFGGQATRTTPATGSVEILDTAAATPSWRTTAPLKYPRLHANAVVLPDGTVLAIGGGAVGKYRSPVKAAELFDPVTETWTELAAQSAQRMYHATAVLLPDGRVLSAGSTAGTLSKTGEIFSPPYLFKGTRPTITEAPATLGYEATATVITDVPVAKMVLIRPCAVTHQIDSDQRVVPVDFTSVDSIHTIIGPKNSAHAPRGYYMLFALGTTGVPSVAKWVKIA
ncbi:MAG: DUF1929 domain-containing protein [Nocardioidaceae bacterium]|nr:DUF1929 domain-containing protein [Nocardioidaceae bacterium]